MALLAAPLAAQLDTGTVTGSVIDASGAAISGARIVLSSELTGVARSTNSNDRGDFTFPLVPAGQYRLTCEKPGFRAYERGGIGLRVNQPVTVSIQMTVGDIADKVTVTEAVPLVDSATAAIRETIDRERITELPLNGRNVLQLQVLLPGSVRTGSLDQGANTPGYSINGGIGASNNYSLDGGQYQDGYFNAPLPFPNPDAIQEFTVQTNSYSAEFGRNRGASINAVTKSGTNAMHGSLFHFLRNDRLDARPFFGTLKPAFKRNQFGASLGGPVRKNRTFFFGSWQTTYERGTPNVANVPVLTARMRAGDFSERPGTLRDPLGGTFPNSQIPASRFSQPSLRVMQRFVPLPNSGQFNFVDPRERPADSHQVVGRVDHELSAKDRIYGRYLWQGDTSFNPGGNLDPFGINQNFKRQSVTVNHTRTFTPALLNSFSFSFNRVKALIEPTPTFNWSEFGSNAPLAAPGARGWVTYTVFGYFALNNGTFWDLGRNTSSFENTLSWFSGRHAFKAGAQISDYSLNQINEFLTQGAFTFNGFATGDARADAVLGRVQQLRQVSTLGNQIDQTLWHFFVTDDIKVSKRLTVNLGTRWEPNLNFTERDGKLSMFQPGRQSTIYAGATRGLLFQGDPQLSPKVLRNQWANLAPRVGFAYDVFGDGRTAVRGGYGLFWDAIRTINLNRFPLIQPFVVDSTVFDVDFANPYPNQNIFPFTPPATTQARRDFRFVSPASHTAFNEDFRTPFSQQWNLNVQRQLPFQTVLTVGYIGSKSTRLFGSHNVNPAVFGPGATAGNTQARRRYPELAVVEDTSTFGFSQYHALQIIANKRMSKGLTIMASYTFGKNTGLTSAQSEGSLGTRDPNNRDLDRGPLNEDRRHILTSSFVWRIPAPYRTRALRAALGGWQLTGIITSFSGVPLTVRAGSDRSLTGQNLDTADVTGDWKLPGGRSRADQFAAWFNTRAFSLPAVGTFGTSSINMLRGPASNTADLGAYRNIAFGERFNVQIRAQFYNAFNHTRLGNPVTTFSSTAFGRIQSVADPRVGELGLKLAF